MIHGTLSLAVFTFCLLELIMSADRCPLWSGSTYSDGRCFQFFEELKNWTDAQTYCKSLPGGGTLAQFTSNTNFSDFVPPSSGPESGLWFGANDIETEGVWRWADQTTAELGTLWDTNEPNNLLYENCAELHFLNHKVNDLPCSYLLPFVCMQECPLGTWGKDCLNSCNTHCRNSTCNGISGICNGCKDGYTGDNCDQECPTLTWGFNCQNICSRNCVNGSCKNTIGFCSFGCLPGYTGDNCSMVCPDFKWGSDCLSSCSKNCANKTCDKRNSKCDNGCVAGYTGYNCTNSCPMLYWGENCSKKCSDNCVNKTCNRFNGSCDKGCQAGYLGNLCDEPCEASKWGAQCKNNCSGHCLNGSPCNITNGWCDAGCEPGYTQENCSEKCPALKWGNQCLNNCSDNCRNKACDFRTGTCDHECETGYCGQISQEATVGQADDKTEYNKGLASGIGVGIGVMIAADILIGVFIYVWLRRRQKQQPTKQRDTTVRQYDHVGTIQQNESHYDSFDKIQNVYDSTERYCNV